MLTVLRPRSRAATNRDHDEAPAALGGQLGPRRKGRLSHGVGARHRHL